MLTFLRNIRKSLLSSGKTSRYFSYAVGEILLVVLGILIALQINNWNELRKERSREFQVLKSLSEDLNTNSINLKNTVAMIPQRKEIIKNVLSYVGSSEAQFTDEMKSKIRNSGFNYTEIIDGTLKSILTGDKLEIIKNDSLKLLLTTYPAVIEKYKEQEENIKRYVLDFQRPKMRLYLSLSEFFGDSDPRIAKFKNNAAKSDHEGLLNNKEYQNILVGILIFQSEFERRIHELKDKTDEIIALLAKELK